MSYDNTNSGILSRNERKEQPNHPDFKGAINVEGVDYWLSGWIKERKDGTGKFFSLSVKAKEQQAPRQSTKPVPNCPQPDASGFDSMEDDVPF